MDFCTTFPRWLSVLVLGTLAMILLGGCGERDDRRFPDLPASHQLNQRPIW